MQVIRVSPRSKCDLPLSGSAANTPHSSAFVCSGLSSGKSNWTKINFYDWPTPNGQKLALFLEETDPPCPARPATERAATLAQRVNPDAGKPMSEEEKKVLFGQGRT